MYTCQICQKVCNGLDGLGIHLTKAHKFDKEEYYLQFLNPDAKHTCDCGVSLNFQGLGRGYPQRCKSCTCSYAGSCNDWSDEKKAEKSVEISERNREMWKDPEYRKNQSERLSKLMTDTNETTLAAGSDARRSQAEAISELYWDIDSGYYEEHNIHKPNPLFEVGIHIPTQMRYTGGYEKRYIYACYHLGIPIKRAEYSHHYFNRELNIRYLPDFYREDTKEVIEVKGFKYEEWLEKKEALIEGVRNTYGLPLVEVLKSDIIELMSRLNLEFNHDISSEFEIIN